MTHGREERIAPRTTAQVVDGVGPRLRALRAHRDVTLAALAAETGISAWPRLGRFSGHFFSGIKSIGVADIQRYSILNPDNSYYIVLYKVENS